MPGIFKATCAKCSNLISHYAYSNRDHWPDEFGGILFQMGDHYKGQICYSCVDQALTCDLCEDYIPDHQPWQTLCQACEDENKKIERAL